MMVATTVLGVFILIKVSLCYMVPNKSLFFKVLDGVERGAAFFSKDYSDLNVDGLYGLRIAEGQLIKAVEECEKKECREDITERVHRVLQVVSETAEKSMPYIREADPKYFDRFRSVVDEPYLLNYKPRRFGNMDDVTIGTDSWYKEEFGDSCYSRLLGSYEKDKRKIPKCNVTDACWDFMTKENTGQYVITHQLLYFILAQHLGCKHAFSKYETADKPEAVLDRLCTNIYKESTLLVQNKQVPQESQDLFLEQTVLCGTLGYEDFQSFDWIKMVLKWQRSDGCFSNNFIKKSFNRKLLRETSMKDGCLSHKSGLGFGVLSTYLRYLIRIL